jgi:hypothetical protein
MGGGEAGKEKGEDCQLDERSCKEIESGKDTVLQNTFRLYTINVCWV